MIGLGSSFHSISTNTKPSMLATNVNKRQHVLTTGGCFKMHCSATCQHPLAIIPKSATCIQAGRGELLRRLNVQLSNWAPLLQRFLKSQDEQACSFAESDAAFCCLMLCHSSLQVSLCFPY